METAAECWVLITPGLGRDDRGLLTTKQQKITICCEFQKNCGGILYWAAFFSSKTKEGGGKRFKGLRLIGLHYFAFNEDISFFK